MKSFFRTLPGKILLFITCILMILTMALSGTAAAFTVSYDFYGRPEEAILEDFTLDQMYRDGTVLLFRKLNNFYEDPLTHSNLLYRVSTESGEVLFSNVEGTFPAPEQSLLYRANYIQIGRVKEYTDIFSVSAKEAGDGTYEYYNVDFALRDGMPVKDSYRLTATLVHLGYQLRYVFFVIAALSLLLAVICFIALMNVSARRPDSEELHPGYFHRIPSDLLLAAALAAEFGMGFLLLESHGMDAAIQILLFAAVVLISLVVVLGLSMSFAARIKDRSLLRNTLIRRILVFLWRLLCRIGRLLRAAGRGILSLIRRLPLIWKTVLAACAVCLLELIVIALAGYEPDNLLAFWFLEKCILLPLLFLFVLQLKKLQAGGRALAAGDLSAQIPLKGLVWDMKEHAENLNHIGVGMSLAVEERMKSERMKTELITNVSHDIKTPLTSIINYASLIDQEPTDNPKITEYSEVLVRQSERLKRLIEDLVEASKASTGNLELALAPCDASVFLTQAGGEYEERLAAAGLTLVTKMPDKEVRILADSRRMWRIFDNLMNNICKYSLAGSRVYLTLEETPGEAVITFKNTSREPLDISEEELMERFVRGDSSRNTEGNGLGLSIARSLAELQQGKLTLSIDGDLFKAVLSFPRIAG